MDFQTGLIFTAVVVLTSAAIIYLINCTTVRENSFEEVKANRRKILKQLHDESRISHEKAKEKKSKKQKKQKGAPEPEKKASFSESESQTNDEDDVKLLKPKEILVAKEAPAPVIQEKITKETKPAAAPEKPAIVKQEKKEGKRAKSTPVEPQKKIKVEAAKPQETAPKIKEQPTTTPAPLPEQAASAPVKLETSPKENKPAPPTKDLQIKPVLPPKEKKKKRDLASLYQITNDNHGVNMSLLLDLLQKAELSRSEIQLLIDFLLNMQQQETSAEWLTGRQDPIVKMKKQLAEKEKALSEEKEISTGLYAKLKALRAELNAEKSLVRNVEESVAIKQNELQAALSKNELIAKELQTNINLVGELQKRLNEEHLAFAQLKEERAVDHKSNEATLAHLSSQLQEQTVLNSQLTEENVALKENIANKEDINKELKCRLQNLQILEDQIVKEKGEKERLAGLVVSLQNETQNLREDNARLTEQLASRQESIKQKDNKENGDVNFSLQTVEELHISIKEKDSKICQLTCELDQKDRQMEKLNNEVINCKNEFNKKQTLLDNATAEIRNLGSQILVFSSALEKKEATITLMKSEVASHTEEITSLKGELESAKQKNNDLRNKNWKVMEALQRAEKELETRKNTQSSPDRNIDASPLKTLPPTLESSQGMQTLKAEINELLERIYNPSIEDRDVKRVSNLVENFQRMLCTLETENSILHSRMIRCKEFLENADGMLQNLQVEAEDKETQWEEQLQSLQEEISSLKGSKPSQSGDCRSNGVSADE